jgi:hypothetical protein
MSKCLKFFITTAHTRKQQLNGQSNALSSVKAASNTVPPSNSKPALRPYASIGSNQDPFIPNLPNSIPGSSPSDTLAEEAAVLAHSLPSVDNVSPQTWSLDQLGMSLI